MIAAAPRTWGRLARLAGVACVGLASTTLLAQYALDANLKVGGGGANPYQSRLPIHRDIYQVNERTGTFQYDTNSAFAMPRYQPGNPRRNKMSAADYSYHRPIQTTGPDAGVFTIDRRSGTFRYNQANALGARGYQVYQSAAPPRPADTMPVGTATPVYHSAPRQARRGQITTPVRDVAARPIGTTTSYTPLVPTDDPRTRNLKPQKYRVPYAEPPIDRS